MELQDLQQASLTIQRDQQANEEFSANLCVLTKDADFADFAICIGDTRLRCSRAVLAANSDVLKAAIKTDMAEKNTGEMRLDYSVEVVQLLLEYMCRGKVQVEQEFLCELLEAADYLQMNGLRQQCIHLINTNTKVTVQNLQSTYRIALMFPEDLKGIREQCIAIATLAYPTVIRSEEFLQRDLANLRRLFELFQGVNVTEDARLEAAVTWIIHNTNERAEFLEELLEIINLEKCTPEALQQFTEEHAELMKASPNVYKSFIAALVASHQTTTKPPPSRAADGKLISESVVAISAKKGSDRGCWLLDLKSHRMTRFTEIPDELHDDYSSLCSTNDGFALMGGAKGRCVRFLSAANRWINLRNLPLRTTENAALLIRNQLFAIGGRVRHFGFERPGWRVFYLHSDGTWHQGPALPRRMSFPLVATLDGSTAYVLHRTTGELFFLDLSDIPSVDVIDLYLLKSIWRKATTVPSKKATGMVALGERLYIQGADVAGYYEPATGVWCKIKPPSPHEMPVPSPPLVGHDGKLYLFGAEMEEYDPDAQNPAWTRTGWSREDWSFGEGHKISALQVRDLQVQE